MNTVTSSDDWPNNVEKNGGNPAVFCSDSTALLFIEVDGNKLITIREKPIITQLVNAGIYLLNQSIIDLIGEQKAIDMPDLILKGVKQDLSIFTFPIYEYWLDIGQPQTLEQAQRDCYNLSLDDLKNT